MPLVRKRGFLAVIFACLTMILGTSPGAAENQKIGVVVASDTDKIEIYDEVYDNTKFSLVGDEAIKILFTDGNTMEFSAPFEGIVSSSGHQDGDIAGLLDFAVALMRREKKMRPGYVRGGESENGHVIEIDSDEIVPPKKLGFDVVWLGRTKKLCVPAGAKPLLWRLNTDKPLEADMWPRNDKSKIARVSWMMGANSTPWPEQLEIRNQLDYVIVPTSGDELVTSLRLVVRESAPKLSDAALLKWYDDNGCKFQARIWVANVSTIDTD